MPIVKFSDEALEELLTVAVRKCVEEAVELDQGAGPKMFVLWCRIVAELHSPTATLEDASRADINRTPHMPIDDIEGDIAAAREGVMAAYAVPRCIHGVPMAVPHLSIVGEPCERCESFNLRPDAEVNGSVKHLESCPASSPEFVLDLTRDQCNCGFGRRLAEAIGVSYGS